MITWATDRVAIGDASDSREATQDKFDASINVAVDLDICDKIDPDVIDHVHIRRHKVGLLDGKGNHTFSFVAAVALLEGLWSQGKRVLVHCHAGQSRSVMVVSTWMDLKGIMSLDDALEKNMTDRKVPIYRQDMYALANDALIYLRAMFPKNHPPNHDYTGYNVKPS